MTNRNFEQLADASELERHLMEKTAQVIAHFHQSAEPAAVAEASAALQQRITDGRIRHCHGHLCLRNIELTDGVPVLIHGLEDAPMDVFQDMAVLLSDLLDRGLGNLASILLNRYLDITGDDGGLLVLPSYFSLLAKDAGSRATAAPRLIAVGGLSGGGKSRMSRELAHFVGTPPGARVLRTDVLRKRLAGIDALESLDQSGYTAEMTERTYHSLFENTSRVLAMGHSVIADAVFADQGQRQAIEAVAAQSGVPFDGLWIEAPATIRMERVAKRINNPSDVTPEIVLQQLDYDLGDLIWPRIDSSGPRQETMDRGRTLTGL